MSDLTKKTNDELVAMLDAALAANPLDLYAECLRRLIALVKPDTR